MRSTVREVRFTNALPATARWRVARSVHPFRDVMEGAEKEPPEQLQRNTVVREGRSNSTIAPRDFVSRILMVTGLSPKIGSAALQQRNKTPLGQRGRVGGSTLETHSRKECIRVCCVRAPVSVKSDVGSNGSATPHQRPIQFRKIGGLVRSIDGRNFSRVHARLTAFARSLLARPA